jgi:hypothetical protein
LRTVFLGGLATLSLSLTPTQATDEPAEWTLEQARQCWQPMVRPVQHVGVPGYQFQTAVMWDGALVFGPLDFRQLKVMQAELAPLGETRLHVSVGLGQPMWLVDRPGTANPMLRRFLENGRLPIPHVVTASKLIDHYELLPGFLRQLGFASCTFSYPLTTLGSSYLSFSKSSLVSYTPEELIQVFEQIKLVRRRGGLPVLNPTESLTDMQRHLRGEPERFGCLGGYKYFYLDWNLNLYRCHYWEKPICRLEEFDATKLIRDGCTRCMIDCYRDPSVLQFAAVSAGDAFNHLKRGRLLAAGRALWDWRNLVSLRAVWENRKWIGQV